MTRRTCSGRWSRRGNLVAAIGTLCVVMVLGCGGGGGNGDGGGGGGITQPCGSAEGSTVPVVCGRVMLDLTTTPAEGVSVILRDSAGNELRRTSTDASGNFKFSPATNGTQLEISAPPASYTATMVRYQGRIYDFELPNQAGTGKCYIGTGVKPGDTNIGIVYVFPITSPPPPPMGGCPR